jgi:hypothetical protein
MRSTKSGVAARNRSLIHLCVDASLERSLDVGDDAL